jgi:CRP/FNR family transcriptional regulator
METTDTAKIIAASCAFWDRLTSGQQERLLDNTVLMRYAKGACVHNGANDCKGMLVIKNGTLRTYMLSESGKEITLFRLSAGDVCVLSASCVLSAITFEVQIDAETDSEVLLINPLFLEALAEENIYVECFAYKTATDRFSDVMWAMQQILFMSMDKRLAVFLWDEIVKTNDDTVRLTHEQVARVVGTAREVVSRMLKYFSSEGIVELSRGGIKVVDRQKLRKLTE